MLARIFEGTIPTHQEWLIQHGEYIYDALNNAQQIAALNRSNNLFATNVANLFFPIGSVDNIPVDHGQQYLSTRHPRIEICSCLYSLHQPGSLSYGLELISVKKCEFLSFIELYAQFTPKSNSFAQITTRNYCGTIATHQPWGNFTPRTIPTAKLPKRKQNQPNFYRSSFPLRLERHSPYQIERSRY